MDVTGILPLFKPAGMTSHDCVVKIRKLFHTKKVGHTGTLDPDVEGVLPICLGRATKVAQYMSDYPKTYEGEVTLGYSTTTEDRSGEKVYERLVDRTIDEIEVSNVLHTFLGEIVQIPPMFSAVKVKGKRLYEYARAGIEVKRPERRVHIHSLDLTSKVVEENGLVRFRFRVHCSKGTYVRTLAVDIGEKIGYPAHMSDLTRTASGPFELQQCLTFAELEKRLATNDVASVLLPLELAIAHLPKQVVNSRIEEQIKNGAVLPRELFDENHFSVYNEKGICLAVYKQHPTKPDLVKPEKMLFSLS
ncbi:tRNA pseudouridine(55) synthase TruB [Halalkalibacterium ligniniphilum]|uniref:tRNA pseudouridine(55) synthase TruB n=1 Tax=Halalkalibacterium ligniniphilum TaxID=1134413 RepID=UPI00036DA60C|nr:tRNA pseudouridine(55) synthase TruB [Halalkalibacterium ligniniphilum]